MALRDVLKDLAANVGKAAFETLQKAALPAQGQPQDPRGVIPDDVEDPDSLSNDTGAAVATDAQELPQSPLSRVHNADTDMAEVQDRVPDTTAEIAAARQDPRSLFWDPYAVIDSLGYKDRPSPMTYATLRAMVWKMPILQAIIQTRLSQVSAFAMPQADKYSTGFRVRMRDQKAKPTKATEARSQQIERWLLATGATEHPEGRDDFETFLTKVTRDSLTYDAATFEIVPSRSGKPAEFYAVDASTIRLADTTKIFVDPEDQEAVRYVQIYDGLVVSEYTAKQLSYGVRNPSANIKLQGYGQSELEMMISVVTALLWASDYNMKHFSQGAMTKGVLNFQGTVPEKQLRAFRRHWYSMVAGIENCLDGSTTIWTDRGTQTLEALVSGGARQIKVWDGLKWCPAEVYQTREPKTLTHTKLGNGTTLSGSPDHRFLILCSETGLPVWKAQQELQLGDFVTVNRQSPPTETPVPAYKGRSLTLDMAELLGWSLGDGYLVHQGRGHARGNLLSLFFHHEKERDIWQRFTQVLQEFEPTAAPKEKFLSEAVREKVRARYGFKTVAASRLSLNVHAIDFIEWLLQIGFTPSAQGKNVPSSILNWPEEYRAAFLRGFFSADGHLQGGRTPGITIASHSVRAQTRDLLLTLGIRTALSEGKTKTWIDGAERSLRDEPSYLRVKDRDVFFARVGFLQAHKQPTDLKRLIEGGKSDGLPASTVLHFLRLVRTAHLQAGNTLLTKRERMDLNSIMSGADVCSRPRLLRYLATASIEPPAWLTDFHYEPIVDIERTETSVPMYDLSVSSDAHQFIANGAVVHNSYKTPIMNAEQGMQWVDMQKSNRDMEFSAWFDFNIKIAAALFQMDPMEVNFKYGTEGGKAMFESSNTGKLVASKDKGLKPLLRFLQRKISTHLVTALDPDFEFEFVGLDTMTASEQADLNGKLVKTLRTVDELRALDDLPPLPNGMGDIILDSVYLQHMQAAQQMAQQAQQAAQQPQDDQQSTDQDFGDDQDGQDEGEAQEPPQGAEEDPQDLLTAPAEKSIQKPSTLQKSKGFSVNITL